MDIKELLGDKYKDDMTAAEITEALKDVSMPKDNSAEMERLKNSLSKANSEAADYKKQLRAKMSEDEAKAAKDKEDREALEQKYNELLHKTVVSENKARLIGLGYDEKLAEDTAKAMADGDTEKIFANQKKHMDAVEKRIRADVLKDTPKPTPDGEANTMTLKKLRELPLQERIKFQEEHGDEYAELYKKGE